ncbi:MAG: hypothetical protein VYD18_13105 [Candidatus Latescibacterota bacterium]|nr:hypothetical protein [Candidatus Latescibacterota bacterium]
MVRIRVCGWAPGSSNSLRDEMNGRFGAIGGRFDRLHAMFVSLMIGIGGLVIAVGELWFKL